MQPHLRPNRFTPFRLAADTEVVGMHDGSQATLRLGALDDEVVHHHEYGHEALFTRTIDGALLALLWRVMDDPRHVGAEQLATLSVTANTLAVGSVDAHETFATYYGIKLVDPEVGRTYVPRLPADYRVYYDAAAGAIDGLFGSTFMQVRVATTLAHHAFESRFVLRFLREPWVPCREQQKDEQPNLRLHALLVHLAACQDEVRALLLERARRFFQARRAPGWDLDDEAAWHAEPTLAHLLDLELDRCLAAWLHDRRVVPAITEEERLGCAEKLTSFASELGVTLRRAIGNEAAEVPELDPTLAHFRRDAATRVHAWRQAGSFVANASMARSFPAATGAALWEIDDYRLADKLVVISGDPDDLPDLWTVLRIGPPGAPVNVRLADEPAHAVHYMRDDVIDWVNRLQPEHGWTGRQPDLIVLALGNERRAGRRAFSCGAVVEPGCIDPRHNERTAIYVMSNWVDFVERTSRAGRVQLAQIEVDLSGFGEQAQSLTINIARCEAMPGPWFMRVLASQAAASAALLALDWRANPAIQSVHVEELLPGAAIDGVKWAMSSILACWSRF